MTRRLLGTVLASALASALVLVAPPSSAQRAPLLVVDDPRGDVKVTDREGPTTYLRKGIDLTQFKVASGDLQEPSVRFTFRIRFLTQARRLVQRIDVLLDDADPGSPDVDGDVVVRLQGPASHTAYTDVTDEDGSQGIACAGTPPRIVRDRGLVKVEVPRDCLPPGLLSIRVRATTVGPHVGPEGAYSRDTLKVPGSHDLGGTAGSKRRG